MTTKSFVEIGTSFEFLTLKLLKSYGFKLEHFGGGNDMGIDLRGSWILPFNQMIDTIVQCKHENKLCTSRYVRELHGTISSVTGDNNVLGILVHNLGFSSACRMALNTSTIPILACVAGLVDNKPALNMAAMNNLAYKLLPNVVICNQRQLNSSQANQNISSILYKLPDSTFVDLYNHKPVN